VICELRDQRKGWILINGNISGAPRAVANRINLAH
jgi:hypothetical protein